MKITTSCSHLHFKELVLQFISNTRLEKNLYPSRIDNNDEYACEMELKTQLEISIDLAHSVEYFHHDSFVQVVHCY